MSRILTEEARIANFERNWGHSGCTCFISPPCGWCTDPDNPLNVHEEDDAWQDVAPPQVDYMKAVRDMCR